MRRVYLTIEQAVEKCYPKATKEEKAKLVMEYRKVVKNEPIVNWEPESKEEEQRIRNHMAWHLEMQQRQWMMNPGLWRNLRQQLTGSSTQKG